MENAEEILHFLEEFSKRKTRTIPQELNEYLAHVARTGDPVYQWSLVKSLFKEKLLNVITDFHETSPGIDIPPYPNVDPFNYDTMKNSLLERLDSFTAAPFTVQRICELLTYPRKQYNRIDKFMRAIEKNILVVSTREPGLQRHSIEPDNGEHAEQIVNGSDNNSEYNVDVEMEDMTWKENSVQQQSSGPQPGSSDGHISVDDVETHLQTKKEVSVPNQDKTTTEYESLTPPELNNDPSVETKITEENTTDLTISNSSTSSAEETEKIETPIIEKPQDEEIKDKLVVSNIIIPEIKIDDSEMTELKLSEQSLNAMNIDAKPEQQQGIDEELKASEEKASAEVHQSSNIIDENSTDSITKDEPEPKLYSEISTSSEESSSSSDIIDGNSNSPKTDCDSQVEIQAEQSQTSSNSDSQESVEGAKQLEDEKESVSTVNDEKSSSQMVMQSDNYSISDVNSILPQIPHKLEMESTTSTLETEDEKSVQSEDNNDSKTELTEMTKDKET